MRFALCDSHNYFRIATVCAKAQNRALERRKMHTFANDKMLIYNNFNLIPT